jgi:SseB protein.
MIEINKQLKNQKLIEAIKAFKKAPNQNSEQQFIKNLREANLLVPILKNKELKPLNQIELNKDLNLEIQDLQNLQGERYIPVFTDWNELNKSTFTVPISGLVFTYEDCKNTIINRNKWQGIVINPYTQNIVLGKKQFEYISNKPEGLQKDQSVMIGEPASYPEGLLEALKDIFSTMKKVKKAYFLLMVKNNVNKSYLLILDIDGNPNDIFPKIGAKAATYLTKEEALDFVVYNTSFGKSATADKRPFYSK